MKQGIDTLRVLRYNLGMMGISISGPSYNYVEYMSVVHNTSRPDSVLRKQSNSVCHYVVHELVAIGEFLVGHIPSKGNVADLMTKFFMDRKQVPGQ